MVLNKREQKIIIGISIAVAVFLADRFILEPYWAADAAVNKATAAAASQLEKQGRLLKNAPVVDKAWRELLQAGVKTDPAAAESQVLHALRDWSQSSGIELQSVKPDRSAEKGEFQEIRFSASGTGRTSSIARLLWNLETAGFPLRLGDMRVSSRTDGNDDLNFQCTLTTLVYVGQPAPKAAVIPSSGPATKGATQK